MTNTRANEPAVIFFDVDGTLLWFDKDAPASDVDFDAIAPLPSVYDAFRRLHERGHKTFICSGRPMPFITQPILDLGVTGLITAAGARITVDGEVLQDTLIEPELVREMARRLIDLGVPAMFESHETPVALMPEGAGSVEMYEMLSNVAIAHTLEELEKIAPSLRFCKICYESEFAERAQVLHPWLSQHFTLCDMGMGSYEMSPIGVNKGVGVRRVLELLGHGVENTYAIGDSENDFAMLEAVETPIAMGNAMQHVKDVCVYVTGPAYADGIQQALEHFGLI